MSKALKKKRMKNTTKIKTKDKKLVVVNEIHKPARKHFPRRHTIIKGYRDLFQIDLGEFHYAKENNGYKYILFVIDCYSKFLWTRALKSKNAEETTSAMKDVLKEVGYPPPRNIQSDDGTEFWNHRFAKLMKQNNINHYSTYSTLKAAIVERVIRTIKNKLYKKFSYRGSYKWTDILQDITHAYNHQKHRTINMKPADVTSSTKLDAYNYIKIAGKNRYNVGDTVRISKYKHVFEKSYTPNWTTELFKIVKVQTTNPVTYLLADLKNNPILGAFYEHEISPTQEEDTYLIEKVLSRKGNKLTVKWLGINEISEIDVKNILK